jgi:hypothetical protein
MSTPNGRQGFFYHEWNRASGLYVTAPSVIPWTAISVPATACPRIAARFLEEERLHLTDQAFRQEYLCEFVSADDSFFDPEAFRAAFSNELDPIDPGAPRYTPPPAILRINGIAASVESKFFVGLDLGQTQDYSAISVLEVRTAPTGEFDHFNYAPVTATRYLLRYVRRIPLKTPYPDVIAKVRDLLRSPVFTERATLVVDATGVGKPVYDLLREGGDLNARIVAVSITAAERVSLVSSIWHVPRRDLLATLQLFLHRRNLLISAQSPDAMNLSRELAEFTLSPAQTRRHDDLIFATALALWKAYYPSPPIHGPGPLNGIHPASRRHGG